MFGSRYEAGYVRVASLLAASLPAAAQKTMPAFPAAWMAALSALLEPPPPKEALMATTLTPRFFIIVAYWTASNIAASVRLVPSFDALSAIIFARKLTPIT